MPTSSVLIATAVFMNLHAHGVESTTAEIPPTVVPNVPQLPFDKYALANGLEVILHEDHRMPEVVVDVWYKVGSKDEVAGRTGFAHLFEHVMFPGHQARPGGQAFRVSAEGGRLERQRIDVGRPHQLLRGGPLEPGRAGAVAGE